MGPFTSANPEMAGFLSTIGSNCHNPHAFVARNFLLDEGVLHQRVESYRRAGAMADHRTVEGWQASHNAYLASEVFRLPAGGGPPNRVDPTDPDSCPETFRFIDPESPFLWTDPNVSLLRVEEVGFIASRCGSSPRDVMELARMELARRVVGSGAPSDVSRDLDALLHEWARNIELRPVYAGLWADFEDLFGPDPTQDPPDWPDDLRDRLGLAHIDPGDRTANIDVLVFRYPVSAVPVLKGAAPDSKPLVPPTVLDGKHSDAFCPSPHNSLTGHAIDLSGSPPPLRREVLHPTIDFGAKHLWRVGTVRRRVELGNLPIARGLHLLCVRQVTDRPDYASRTDADLF